MKRINWLVIILLVLAVYKIIDIKLEAKYYELENDLYNEIIGVYENIERNTDFIIQLNNSNKK